MGFEPEKVAALNKQSSGLFVAGESLSGSESQLACKAQCAAADGESLMVHQTKESIVRYSFLFYVVIRTRIREGRRVKQTVQWTVFRKKSLSGSESQLVCKAQCAVADGESLMVHHQNGWSKRTGHFYFALSDVSINIIFRNL